MEVIRGRGGNLGCTFTESGAFPVHGTFPVVVAERKETGKTDLAGGGMGGRWAGHANT